MHHRPDDAIKKRITKIGKNKNRYKSVEKTRSDGDEIRVWCGGGSITAYDNGNDAYYGRSPIYTPIMSSGEKYLIMHSVQLVYIYHKYWLPLSLLLLLLLSCRYIISLHDDVTAFFSLS